MMALSSLKIGKISQVTRLNTEEEVIIRRLMSIGVIPGIDLTLEQKFPSYIIKIGRTRAALDRETAQVIYVESK